MKRLIKLFDTVAGSCYEMFYELLEESMGTVVITCPNAFVEECVVMQLTGIPCVNILRTNKVVKDDNYDKTIIVCSNKTIDDISNTFSINYYKLYSLSQGDSKIEFDIIDCGFVDISSINTVKDNDIGLNVSEKVKNVKEDLISYLKSYNVIFLETFNTDISKVLKSVNNDCKYINNVEELLEIKNNVILVNDTFIIKFDAIFNDNDLYSVCSNVISYILSSKGIILCLSSWIKMILELMSRENEVDFDINSVVLYNGIKDKVDGNKSLFL